MWFRTSPMWSGTSPMRFRNLSDGVRDLKFEVIQPVRTLIGPQRSSEQPENIVLQPEQRGVRDTGVVNHERQYYENV